MSVMTDHSLMQFDDLPDDVMIQVFRCVSPSTIAKCRRTNKRLNTVIQQSRIGRPSVDEMSVQIRTSAERTAPIGRLQMKKSKEYRRKTVVTMKRQEKLHQLIDDQPQGSSMETDAQTIEKAMKTIKFAERLSFDGIQADSSFYDMIVSRGNELNHVTSLTFTLARISMSEAQFILFLQKTNLTSLTLDFCHFNQDIISDKLMMHLPALRCFRVQPRAPTYLQLSDETLKLWNSKPPTTIGLYNCTTAFSLHGILLLLKNAPNDPIDWDFGRIQLSANSTEAFLALTMSSGLSVNITDDYRSKRIEIRRTSSKIAFNVLHDDMFTM